MGTEQQDIFQGKLEAALKDLVLAWPGLALTLSAS